VSCEGLVECIKDDDSSVDSEDVVLHAMLGWVRHDVDKKEDVVGNDHGRCPSRSDMTLTTGYPPPGKCDNLEHGRHQSPGSLLSLVKVIQQGKSVGRLNLLQHKVLETVLRVSSCKTSHILTKLPILSTVNSVSPV